MGRPRDEIDRPAVLGLCGAFHEALDLAKLPAHLDDDLARGPADRQHAQRAEQEGQDAAEEQPDDHQGVGQIEWQMRPPTDFLGVRGEEHQGREPGGADRVSLGDGFGRVANGIEGVGDISNRLGEVCHLGDAAGIIRDRAVGVDGDDDARHREHRHGGDGDAVQAIVARLLVQKIRHQDADADDEHREGRADHADRLAGDDVGRGTGRRGARDQPDRWKVRAGEELGDPHQRDGHHDADDGGPEQVDIQAGQQRHHEKAGQRQHGADAETAVEGTHDPGAAAETDK